MTTADKIILCIIAAILLFMGGLFVHAFPQWFCPKCPPVPSISDSVWVVPACTVYIPRNRIVIRENIKRDTITDTLKIKEIRIDTGTSVGFDTCTNDGARIQVSVCAKLIIPPVEASLIYTPPIDTIKKFIFRDTLYLKKKDWGAITIGTLSGFTVGIGIITVLILKGVFK
jgi:hypothetical protein